ncbi:hypothetical protein KIN20_015177 [Parelaphostrongylus tenuis]|uniref:Uncharacterized protein n=1 Tax=Parelaphostrongylus tenuis TaxID=148309 RepID=A0AAD5MFQ8_PARTN|nr:hypothetical protein KIN20_015177 [Parelaphostrongylus tenuis]
MFTLMGCAQRFHLPPERLALCHLLVHAPLFHLMTHMCLIQAWKIYKDYLRKVSFTNFKMEPEKFGSEVSKFFKEVHYKMMIVGSMKAYYGYLLEDTPWKVLEKAHYSDSIFRGQNPRRFLYNGDYSVRDEDGGTEKIDKEFVRYQFHIMTGDFCDPIFVHQR